jgi:hypothetical protein
VGVIGDGDLYGDAEDACCDEYFEDEVVKSLFEELPKCL